MARRVLRYDVMVNDHVQEVGGGQIVLIACRRDRQLGTVRVMEVWTEEEVAADWPDSDPAASKRKVLVVGTGHPIPEIAGKHIGSAIDFGFVWHMYEVSV